MPKTTEQTSKSDTTQSSDASSAENKDFKSLSLKDMESELQKQGEELEEQEEQPDKKEASEPSKEDSDTEDDASSKANDEDNDSDDEKTSKDEPEKSAKPESVNEKLDKLEKAYKELQGEFTRRNQSRKELEDEIAELKQGQKESPQSDEASKMKKDVLAQLKEENPKAAKFIDALGEAIEQRIGDRLEEKVKPIEDRVTLRTRKDNKDKFLKELDSFKKSELKELEPEILAIYNGEPSFWQNLIFESDSAFNQLLDQTKLQNLKKVAEIMTRGKKAETIKNSKKKEIEKTHVGKPSGKTKEVPAKDFKKLSLKEMEAALPKVDE